jgi:hypothetical protein
MRDLPKVSTSGRPAGIRTGRPGRPGDQDPGPPRHHRLGETDPDRGRREPPNFDVALAVESGADAIVLDGMQGGTAATQDVFIEHVGIPILAAIPQALASPQELGMHREVRPYRLGRHPQRG